MPQLLKFDVAWISKKFPESNFELLRPLERKHWTERQKYGSYDPPLYGCLSYSQYESVPQLDRGSILRYIGKPRNGDTRKHV